MDISLLSLVIFSIITYLYFALVKPTLTIDVLNTPNGLNTYYSSTYSKLGIYLLAIILSQCGLNFAYLANKCGGNLGKNAGVAFIFTIIPWLLIFGIMIAVLLMYPGFKGVFSDVVGYYVVYWSANNLFSKILVDSNVRDALKNEKNSQEMETVAKLIMKMIGNKSVLINELNPENFLNVWNTLKPLMLPDAENYKQELLDLVVLKDNVGEGLWYLYTGILISSIVYYNLSSRGCIKDVETLKKEQENYVKEQEQIEESKANATEYVFE
jgi:hypothetical protein